METLLKGFTLTKVGFNESIKINDVFDFKGETWIVRAIANQKLKPRRINGLAGYQYDVIEIEVAAQKAGTFNIINASVDETIIVSKLDTSKINDGNYYGSKRLVSVGDICDCGDGRLYVATEVLEIKYSFIDINIKLKASSVKEIKSVETNKLVNQHQLDKLGWKIIGKSNAIT